MAMGKGRNVGRWTALLLSAVGLVQVNVDENGALAEQYGIRGIPALFMIKGGQVAGELVGYQEKHELERFVERYL